MIYLIRLADKLDIDLEEAVQEKMKLNEKNYPLELAKDNAIKYNDNRANSHIQRVHKIIGKNIKNKKIAVLGVTFKPNTDDMRDSTSLKMIPYLSKKGALINYYDPSGEKKELKKIKNCFFKKNIMSNCINTDLIILLTEWDEFKTIDFKRVIKNKKFKVFDLRNLYNPEEMRTNKIEYYSFHCRFAK